LLHPHPIPLGTTLCLTCFCLTHLSLLAQSTEFEVDETFTVNASVYEDDDCYDSDSVSIEVHDSVVTFARMSYVDVVLTVPTSSVMTDDVPLDPLDTPHASSLCSLPSPSPECHNVPSADFHYMLQGDVFDCRDSLDAFRGYNPSFDPYGLYLESMPLKIIFITAFHSFTDFLKAFNKFTRALAIISAFLFKCFYSHASELHAQMFDKLLRALTASE